VYGFSRTFFYNHFLDPGKVLRKGCTGYTGYAASPWPAGSGRRRRIRLHGAFCRCLSGGPAAYQRRCCPWFSKLVPTVPRGLSCEVPRPLRWPDWHRGTPFQALRARCTAVSSAFSPRRSNACPGSRLGTGRPYNRAGSLPPRDWATWAVPTSLSRCTRRRRRRPICAPSRPRKSACYLLAGSTVPSTQ